MIPLAGRIINTAILRTNIPVVMEIKESAITN